MISCYKYISQSAMRKHGIPWPHAQPACLSACGSQANMLMSDVIICAHLLSAMWIRIPLHAWRAVA